MTSDEPRRSGLRVDVIVSLGTAVAVGAMGFVSSALAARLLQPDQRGTLAAIQVIPGFLALLGMVGQVEAVTYFAARRKHPLGLVQGTSLRILARGCGFAALAGLVFVPLLLRGRPAAVMTAGLLYLAIIPGLGLLGVGTAWLRARNRMVSWNLTRLIAPMIWTLLVIVAWVRSDRSVTHLAISFATIILVVAIPTVWWSNRSIGERVTNSPPLRRPLMRFGLPAMLTAAPQVMNLRLDQMVMAGFLPDRELGYYVTAVGWSTATSLLLNGFGFVLLPAIASELDVDKQREIFRKLVLRGAMLTLVLVGAFLIVTPVVFPSPLVFGESYRPALPSALVLVIAAGVVGFNQIASEGIRGLGKPRLVLWSEVSGLVVAIVALAALLPSFGIIGAAVASLVGYTTVTVLLLMGVTRWAGDRLPWLDQLSDSI